MKKTTREISTEMNFKVLPLLALLLSLNSASYGQNYTESRAFRKEFSADKNTSLDIVSKYGSIQIINGKSDSVLVRAEITVTSSNEQKTRKMLNDVSVNLVKTGSIIRVQSDFGKNPGFLLESFKNMTGKIISYDNQLEINYYIAVPEGIALKIDNTYGDIYLEDIKGNLDLTLSNGSLQSGFLEKAAEVNLTFVNGSVQGIQSGKISASYTELKIGNSGSLDIVSRSSKLEIDSCTGITINSRRDKVYIESVKKLSADSYFSDIIVESVNGEINLLSSYGSFRTTILRKSFSLVSITSQYTDINLGLEKEVSAGVDIKTTSSKLSLYDVDTHLEGQELNSEKKELATYGYIGKTGSNSRITVDALRGSLYIKYK